jgi:hypothetical protein
LSRATYKCVPGAAVATSTTPKSVIGAKAHANSGLDLLEFWIGFDGVTASNAPSLVEVCYCTWATNSPGTNSTSITPVQHLGRAMTVGFTAGRNWTSEPTTLTVLEEHLITPNGGMFRWKYPLGDEPDCALAEGFVLRVTAATGTPNVRCGLEVARN